MKELDLYDFPEFKRPLIKAVNKIGGISAVGRLLNLSRQTIHAWVHLLEKGIPPERCIEIERMTDGEITRQHLRPDIFGKDIEFKPLSIEEELNITMRKLKKLLKGIVWVDTNRAIIRANSKKGAK